MRSDAKNTTTRAQAAKLAAGPGLSERTAFERHRCWEKQGVIPPAIGTKPGGRGDPTLLFPNAYAATFAVMSDLYDAGIVRTRGHLASMFRYLAIPQHEGGEALITHILAAIAAGETCWMVMTLWRHQKTGETVPTCAVRFADETKRPIEAPSQFHDAITDYVVKLHVLLARFTERPAVH